MKLTRMTRTAGWLAVAGLLGAALIAPAATLAVTGPEVTPTMHEGNITTCPAGQGSTIEVDASTTSGSANGVTVTIVYDAATKSLDFTASGGVVWHAFIKGGSAYNHYNYTVLGGIAADDGLVAPDNASGGPAGLSHGIFCVMPTTTTSSETTSSQTTSSDTTSSQTTSSETTSSQTTSSETTSSQTTSSETTSSQTTSTQTTDSETTSTQSTTSTTTSSKPSGSVEAETGTPDPTLPSTDTASLSGGSSPADGTWRLLLVAMAGLLAAALLLTPAAAARKR